MHPVLEYVISFWDPHTDIDKLQDELQKVQNHVKRNYVCETGSMTNILGQSKWETLKRKGERIIDFILLYNGLTQTFVWGLKNKARIPTDDLIPKTRHCRNQYSLAFQICLLVKTPIRKATCLRLTGTGMTSLNLWFPLLNYLMIVCLSSLPL